MPLSGAEMFAPGRIVVAVVCVVFFSYLLLRKKVTKSGQQFPLPPGPRPFPILGNLATLGALPHHSLHKLAKTYGPAMSLRLGSVLTVVISSTEMAEEILKTHDKVFASRPKLTSCEIIGYGNQMFGFMPYGEQWRNARKLFTTKLVTGKRIENSMWIRREEILFMVRSMIEKSEGGSGKTGVPMLTEFFQLATNILTRLMFSKRIFGSSDSASFGGIDFQETIEEIFKQLGSFYIGDYIPFLKRLDLQGCEKEMWAVHQKIDGIVQRLLDARLQDLSQPIDHGKISDDDDIMTALLTQPTESTGKPLSGDQIKAMMVDVLTAGTDTTATTLEWALCELLKNPDTIRMSVEELDKVVGRDRLVEESDVPNLPYLQAVIKEALRLHPPGPLLLPHESIADCTVGGFFIPAQTRVICNVWAISRDPAVWEHPEEFWPSRFMPDQVDSKIDLHGRDYKYLPFGSGRRSCPGKNLAVRVVQYTLAVILQTCHWTLPASTMTQDLDMTEKFGLIVSKAMELKAVATLRVNASLISNSVEDSSY